MMRLFGRQSAQQECEADKRIREGAVSRATELNLSGLGLTALPEAIGNLAQLQSLNISNNHLTALPEAIGNLAQLRRLDVSQNQLTGLSEAIGKLTQLHGLYISGNQLTGLPEAVGKLTQLESLYISGNQLTGLPEAIGRLTQLESLWAFANQLKALPEVIGNLAQLESLNLSLNQITALPYAMRRLTSLTELFLHDNPALPLPAELLGPTAGDVYGEKKATAANPNSILDYYFRVGTSQPLNEAKLILVGFGAVGKTSLAERLVHDRFDSSERKTEGIAITDWDLRLHDGEKVRLHAWDFGGQEIMHATHQFFLTKRSLYLLVLAGRQGREDADAEYWLSLIDSLADRSPVIIVLNKVKEHPFDLNRTALQGKFDFIRDVIKTDCSDRTGLKELARAIRRETDALPSLRDPSPASWVAVKDRLSAMQQSWLRLEDYRRCCVELGVAEPTAQVNLAETLHRLGIALNFRDDRRLRDTHVLNPHWVT
jgi:internalin A